MQYTNYIWKNGLPVGVQEPHQEKRYKIVLDPYRKHITIEKYSEDTFEKILYDSRLLDFRHLKPQEQVGWEKEQLTERECLIRNHHDRVMYLEKHTFEKGVCRHSALYSPHGILLATTKIHYESFDDSFNGITFYDSEKKPVFVKKYKIENGLFTELLEESWELEKRTQKT